MIWIGPFCFSIRMILQHMQLRETGAGTVECVCLLRSVHIAECNTRLLSTCLNVATFESFHNHRSSTKKAVLHTAYTRCWDSSSPVPACHVWSSPKSQSRTELLVTSVLYPWLQIDIWQSWRLCSVPISVSAVITLGLPNRVEPGRDCPCDPRSESWLTLGPLVPWLFAIVELSSRDSNGPWSQSDTMAKLWKYNITL